MILHIPHSSTILPDTFAVAEGVSLQEEFHRMTDWFTDELFDFYDAKKLIFPWSRLYCDVERFRDDKDEDMAKKGMGVCYTTSSFGTRLREVSDEEKEFIKYIYYDSHHEKFEKLVEEELEENGQALIVDCHSFSNEVLPHEESHVRPDICIGTDSFHTPDVLVEKVRRLFENAGLKVEVNEPFSGTIVPLKFYANDRRVKSIMIEVNRKLYLDGEYERSADFHEIKSLIFRMLTTIY